MHVDFQTEPGKYRHWKLDFDGAQANLWMDVDVSAGLYEGYELKLNSYDLGVDIELYDAVLRLRFEHPEVKVVVLRSAKERVFCAGANIRMLAGASHGHKVNFCKFTNETRNTMEESGEQAGQYYISLVEGACAGGGYELALSTDHIMLADDGSASVALPEVPLLAVLPGTGGLTRVTDKRKVRRDRADIFCSIEEGVKGQRAADWRLVDESIAKSKINEILQQRVENFSDCSDRPDDGEGVSLTPLQRTISLDAVQYDNIEITINRGESTATVLIDAKGFDIPQSISELQDMGDQFWLLSVARQLDDALLHLRMNETEIGLILFTSVGDHDTVLQLDDFLEDHQNHWLVREILLYWSRVLKRIDQTSRTLISLIEPESCFTGSLAEICFASDRIYMGEGEFEDKVGEAAMQLTNFNFGRYPNANDIPRLRSRFWGESELYEQAENHKNILIDAEQAEELGLITEAYDDIDWADEIRVVIEERTSFSPDALTGMELNLRCVGPETMESKIFGRLTAWQNWIFQRPNAVGEAGALRRYGSGVKAQFDTNRV